MDKKTLCAGAASAAALWLLAELGRGGVPWTPAFALSLAALWVLRERGGWARHADAAVFFGALALYLSTFRWRGGDDIPTSLIPLALLKHGTFALDPVVDPFLTGKTGGFTLPFNGRLLSIFPVAGGIMALPLYIVPVLAGVVPTETFLHNLSKVSGALITAASAAVFHRVASRRCSRAWALTLTGLYAAGSWSLSLSSQGLWQHGPSQLGVALGLWGLDEDRFRGDVLAGFGFALAFVSRPDAAFFLAAAGLYVLFMARRRLCGFLIGAWVPLALLAAYWLYYTGRLRPPESDYQSARFEGFQLRAALGLLFSPTRGFFLYFTPAVFGLWASLRGRSFWRRAPYGPWLALACAGPWLLISHYYPWTGGNTFGPRYFAPAALILAWCCTELEDEIRSKPALLWGWCVAVALAALTHAAGAYLEWPGSQVFAEQRAELWLWSLHPAAFLFSPQGGLGGLAAPLRLGVASLIAGAFAVLAVCLRGLLAQAQLRRG